MLHQSECGCIRSKGGIIIHPKPAVQLNSSEYNLIAAADLCAQQYLKSWLQYGVHATESVENQKTLSSQASKLRYKTITNRLTYSQE